ncbi:MAG TPA: patatin-like phospholipase family protein [Acidimicrobiia bacterium]
MAMSRVISIDGGGVRGVVPVIVLQRLTQEPSLGDLLATTDLFAGTSTGGLIALALAGDLGLPAILDLYEQRAPTIFHKTLLHQILDLDNLIGATYRLENLRGQLHEVFGERRLAELHTRVLVAAFHLDNEAPDPAQRTWKPKLFHNFPGDDSDGERLVSEVGTYTAAAPTYFPTADGFVDGGVFATNPSMCAVAQTQDRRNDVSDRGDLAQLVLLSLGTGRALQYIKGSHDWGQLQWVRPLIDLMLDGVNGIADYQCRHLLRDRYYRFAPTFEPGVTIGQDAVDQIPFLVDYARGLDLTGLIEWLTERW